MAARFLRLAHCVFYAEEKMSGRRGIGLAVLAICAATAIYFAAGCGAGAKKMNGQSSQARQVRPLRALPSIESKAVLPTGMTITPMAAPDSFYVPLNPGLADFPDYVAGQPVTTSLSPDGKTLLVLTSGYNRMNDASGREVKRDSNEYVFVFDVSQDKPALAQTLEVSNTFNGMA